MKKIFFFSTILFVLIITGCSEEYEFVDNTMSRTTHELKAFIEQEDCITRTMVDKNNRVLWQESDEIGVYGTQGSINALFCYEREGKGTTYFKGELKGNESVHFAYYPYNKDVEYSEGKLIQYLPSELSYTNQSNAPMISVWQNDSNHVFKHTCGLLKFTLRNIPFETEKILITSVGENVPCLAGKTEMDIENDSIINITSEDKKQITIKNLPRKNGLNPEYADCLNDSLTFFVPMAVDVYPKLVVSVVDSTGTVLWERYLPNATIKRAMILSIDERSVREEVNDISGCSSNPKLVIDSPQYSSATFTPIVEIKGHVEDANRIEYTKIIVSQTKNGASHSKRYEYEEGVGTSFSYDVSLEPGLNNIAIHTFLIDKCGSKRLRIKHLKVNVFCEDVETLDFDYQNLRMGEGHNALALIQGVILPCSEQDKEYKCGFFYDVFSVDAEPPTTIKQLTKKLPKENLDDELTFDANIKIPMDNSGTHYCTMGKDYYYVAYIYDVESDSYKYGEIKMFTTSLVKTLEADAESNDGITLNGMLKLRNNIFSNATCGFVYGEEPQEHPYNFLHTIYSESTNSPFSAEVKDWNNEYIYYNAFISWNNIRFYGMQENIEIKRNILGEWDCKWNTVQEGDSWEGYQKLVCYENGECMILDEPDAIGKWKLKDNNVELSFYSPAKPDYPYSITIVFYGAVSPNYMRMDLEAKGTIMVQYDDWDSVYWRKETYHCVMQCTRPKTSKTKSIRNVESKSDNFKFYSPLFIRKQSRK